MSSKSSVALVGCPHNWGQPKGGVENGPRYVRETKIAERIRDDLHRTVRDAGDAGSSLSWTEEQLKSANRNVMVSGVNADLSGAISAVLKAGEIPITVGGDHAFAIGSISAVLKNQPSTSVVWVDAHADINTPAGSISGNIHGMPVAFLMDLDDCRSHYPSFAWMKDVPKLAARNLVYVGLRDLDVFEKRALERLNVRAYSMTEIDLLGIETITREILDYLAPSCDRPLHLSFDIDSLDPTEAPSTGTAVPGGMSFREGRYLCERLHHTGFLRSMDLMEVNPSLGTESDARKTAEHAARLILASLGASLLH